MEVLWRAFNIFKRIKSGWETEDEEKMMKTDKKFLEAVGYLVTDEGIE